MINPRFDDTKPNPNIDNENIFFVDDLPLPAMVNLRSDDYIPSSPLEEYADHDWKSAFEQYGLGASNSHVGCSAMELAYLRAQQPNKFSRLNLYKSLQKLENSKDTRRYPSDIGKALKDYGVCLDVSDNYLLSDGYCADTTKDQSIESLQYQIGGYSSIHDVNNIKIALSQGIPIMAMMECNNEFLHLSGYWKTHQWDTSPNTRILGYHMVLIVGYDNFAGCFQAENSWGLEWGDKNTFGIPYTKVFPTMFYKGITEVWVLDDIGVDYVKYTSNSLSKPVETTVSLNVYNQLELEFEKDINSNPIYFDALRTLNKFGNKRTNLLNILNKPQPKGLGLNVSYKPNTLEILERPKVGQSFTSITSNGEPRFEYKNGEVGQVAILKFMNKQQDIFIIKLIFEIAGSIQETFKR